MLVLHCGAFDVRLETVPASGWDQGSHNSYMVMMHTRLVEKYAMQCDCRESQLGNQNVLDVYLLNKLRYRLGRPFDVQGLSRPETENTHVARSQIGAPSLPVHVVPLSVLSRTLLISV